MLKSPESGKPTVESTSMIVAPIATEFTICVLGLGWKEP